MSRKLSVAQKWTRILATQLLDHTAEFRFQSTVERGMFPGTVASEVDREEEFMIWSYGIPTSWEEESHGVMTALKMIDKLKS